MTEEEDRARKTAAHRRWVAKNREDVNKYKRERREKDRLARNLWRDKNRDKVRAYKRAAYHKNGQKNREINRKARAANPEKFRAYARLHYQRHRDVILERARADRIANPDRHKKWRADNRIRRRARYIISSIKKKCKENDLGFDLTVEWLQHRLDVGVCEMSGLPFDMVAKRGPMSPSVDRKNPSGPYTQANCRMILWYLNRAMSNLGEDFALRVFGEVLKKKNGDVPNA